MEDTEIKRLSALLDDRTMTLMARESDLADRMEEIEAQKEELTAAMEELDRRNKILEVALEDLKERNQELDQILYRASHDLRSPITSIVGVLNILESESSTEIQKKSLWHIRKRTNQMDDLLKSLSTFSKSISNVVHFSRVNLDLMIQICINELHYLPNFSAVTIKTEKEGSGDFITDIFLISIVIKNLLANSITFRNPAKQGGVVLIRTIVSEDYLEIEIVDDGEGISDSIRDKIFNMFYRGSELSLGSGLGLYIVKRVVNQLMGSIQFTCRDGFTRFKVVLPQPTTL